MELRLVKKFSQPQCGSADCPTIYETEDPKVVVIQGWILEEKDRPTDMPAGEGAVAVPVELISWIKDNA